MSKNKKRLIKKPVLSFANKLKGWLAVLGGAFGLGVMVFIAQGYFVQPAEEVSINEAFPGKPSGFDMFIEQFKSIDPAKWLINQTPGSTVGVQSGQLEISVPANSADHWASLKYLTEIPADKDFRIILNLSRPKLTGSGQGFSSLYFQGPAPDYEQVVSVTLTQKAGEKFSSITFGSHLNGQTVYQSAPQTVVRDDLFIQLTRIGKTYSARFVSKSKGGAGDLGQFELDNPDPLYLVLISGNWDNPVGGPFPAVVSRFNSVIISLEK